MIIDSGIATGSLTVSGSLLVTGSTFLKGNTSVIGNLTVSNGISVTLTEQSSSNLVGYDSTTGALYYQKTGSVIPVTSSYAVSASQALNAQTASYAPDYLPLSGGIISGNLVVAGTASIAYLNVVFESASIIYSSGSNILGDAANDTQTLYGTVIIPTGSLQVTGAVNVTQGITGSLLGTASYADFATTASFALNIHPTITASYAINALSASYALTAPYYVLTASYNSNSSSFSSSIANLETWSSSLDLIYATDAQLTASMAELRAGVTASINDLSSSIAPQISTLTVASASFANSINSLQSVTGSYATTG